MPNTQQVFDHHVEGFVARDLNKVLEDYTEDSIIISNGKTFKGLSGVSEFFSELFSDLPKDCAFDLDQCIVLDKNVYITWHAESDKATYQFATDTFTIENGKITLQTVGFVKKLSCGHQANSIF